jgi:hypothetical protein
LIFAKTFAHRIKDKIARIYRIRLGAAQVEGEQIKGKFLSNIQIYTQDNQFNTSTPQQAGRIPNRSRFIEQA